MQSIAMLGSEEQRERWLPAMARMETIGAFGLTEPRHGSDAVALETSARRDGDEWVLSGRKTWISGVDLADAVLVVGKLADGPKGTLRPALFVVPTDAPGFSAQPIPMEIVSPERQFQVFLDDVRLPADALVGHPDQGIAQLFAGLNPERVMAAAFSLGVARLAMRKATDYARTRQVWGTPIGAHQGLAHPLAACQIEIELARLMTQKAAALYDAGDDLGAGEAANMAKYAAGEVAVRSTDQAVQSMGGNGMTVEYGVASLVAASRATRIAPVSREMILNFVAQHSLGLPKSY
jgi:alkylation response protein AidB-like acyl-CoA dehydrogenase